MPAANCPTLPPFCRACAQWVSPEATPFGHIPEMIQVTGCLVTFKLGFHWRRNLNGNATTDLCDLLSQVIVVAAGIHLIIPIPVVAHNIGVRKTESLKGWPIAHDASH